MTPSLEQAQSRDRRKAELKRMEDEYLSRRQTLDFLEKQLAGAAPGLCRSELSSATSMQAGRKNAALSLLVPQLGARADQERGAETLVAARPPMAVSFLPARSSDDAAAAVWLEAASAVELSRSSTPPAIPFPSATQSARTTAEGADADKDVLAAGAAAAQGAREEAEDKNEVGGRRRKHSKRALGYKNRAATVIKRPGGGTDYWPKVESAPARLARELRPNLDADRGPGAQIGERLREWWLRMSLQR